MSIMGRIINSHNKKIVNVTTTTTHRKTDATVTVEKDQCTLDTNCLITSVIVSVQSETNHRHRQHRKELHRTNRGNVPATMYPA